ncbi:MAG: pirin family protein [Sediminibacterium sp.]
MEDTLIEPVKFAADTRGYTEWSWLKSYHSFSFGQYFDPERIQFGALRVLNDDWVAAGSGFGAHPHANMEIVTIPLSGDLHHRDSTGRDAIIRSTDVQIMSAGSGITHSEVNASQTHPVAFLQIWVLPEKNNIEPRYQQMAINRNPLNEWIPLVAPDHQRALFINQQCWMSLRNISAGVDASYQIKKIGHGVYVFVISGSVIVNGQLLGERDAAGWKHTDLLSLQSDSDACILCIEVPV